MRISENIELLRDKDANIAYKALKELIEVSKSSNEVYTYVNDFIEMMHDENSYVRGRGLRLLAYNAKWDKSNKINECIDEYLSHFEDDKPIISRGCIQDSVLIAKAKPELSAKIMVALETFDRIYQDSMQSLIYRDRKTAANKIRQGEE
ncbi:hypothetical protein [Anaerorhabdus furcosa]|uniref:HEAT repeat-containing protein n=1 Tax=Anaerorhabdus furcosa TaxID=118967 RepID=A0A1T4N4F2_9FIRM|nr:hypothetical protein [Anaerorhabdus furcosa]SJZ74123.1 hypothetical protein SAMN02745191_1479 [Anaerorhabdus furcosa]